jgi:hypothetical protein
MHRNYLDRPVAWGVLFVCLAGTAIGCTSKTTDPELTPVAGVVMFDGKPLPDAQLTFYFSGAPLSGYSASLGKTDEAGKYQLKSSGKTGALPGEFKVTISRFVSDSGLTLNPEEGMDLQQLAMQGRAKESLPEKYSSFELTELTATVEKGKSEGYDFDLKGT